MSDGGGRLWVLLTVLGPVILAAVLAYGLVKWRHRTSAQQQLGDGRTRQLYQAEGDPGPPPAPAERRAPPRDWDLEPSEDDNARAKLGPRGVPGAPDPARMTPQQL